MGAYQQKLSGCVISQKTARQRVGVGEGAYCYNPVSVKFTK